MIFIINMIIPNVIVIKDDTLSMILIYSEFNFFILSILSNPKYDFRRAVVYNYPLSKMNKSHHLKAQIRK